MRQAPPHAKRTAYFAAGLIAFFGALLRIYEWYFSRPLWVDEEMILLNVRDRGFADLAGLLWLDQSAPLGWLSLQRLTVLAFGTDDRAVRAVPVLFAIALLGAAVWIAGRWMKPVGAILFLLFCSFGQWLLFYSFEVKPYSADAFFALLLPAIAAWAVEPFGTPGTPALNRTAFWWSVAAIAQWFGNGALFVAPVCALMLIGLAWQLSGPRRAAAIALQGTVWFASFALHYQLTLRHAIANDYLRTYWRAALPPAGSGTGATLAWFGRQLEPLALHPGGTDQSMSFWIVAVSGIAAAILARRSLGLFLLTVPLSAFVLAAFRFVPLGDRLALWTIPPLYAAMAVAADECVRIGRMSLATGTRTHMLGAVAGLVIVSGVSWNIVRRGHAEYSHRPESNHNLDDQSALRFLMAQRQPGDVLLATHMGLPAIWWYADVNVAPPNLGTTYEPDGTLILELSHINTRDCAMDTLKAGLSGKTRAAVYLGFGSRTPEGFQELVLDRLSELGTMTAYRGVAEDGRVAIFDLRLPPKPWEPIITRPGGQSLVPMSRPAGCVNLEPAARW